MDPDVEEHLTEFGRFGLYLPNPLAKARLNKSRSLTRAGKVACLRLVKDDLAIDRDLEDSLGPRAKLNSA